MQIVPTILGKEMTTVEAKLMEVEKLTDWIQIDVIDGIFTTGKTFELELLKSVDKEKLWEIHLMVKEPINWVAKCVFAGAIRIIGQVEMMDDREEFVKRVKNEGLEAGLGFDIGTEIDNKIPEGTDLVLLMARKAGFENFKFEKKVLKKIKKAKEMGFRVGVDGGIDADNYQQVIRAGADIIYSGKHYLEIWKKPAK